MHAPVPTSAGDAVDHFLFPWHLRPCGEDSELTDVPQTLVNPMQRCRREGDGGTWGMELLFRSDGQGDSHRQWWSLGKCGGKGPKGEPAQTQKASVRRAD